MTQPVEDVTPPQFPVGELALAAAEASIAALVLSMLSAWLTSVAATVMAPFVLFGLAPDPAAVWSLTQSWERQVRRLLEGLEAIARSGWMDAAEQLGVDLPFRRDDPMLQEALERTRNFLVRIPNEVYRLIVSELGAAVNLGESVSQQAARVRRVFDVTGSEFWPDRARTVAVTEVHRAYNFGFLAAAMRWSQLSGVALFKRWESRDDARVRPAHHGADGQVRALAQPFVVGGEGLMAPGDPAGSAWNVIQCRCKMLLRKGL